MGVGTSSHNSAPVSQPILTEKPFPHNFKAIVTREKTTPAEADEKADEKQVRLAGIYLAGKTKKYWVDEENNNCFMIFPRGMSIVWGDDRRYWSWTEENSDDGKIQVAELLNVCWLEIHGNLELSYLNPKVTYEVFFEIKLKGNAAGWNTPVDLRLKLPDGSVQERKENLDQKPKDRCLLLKVGEIQPQMGQEGDVVVSLFRYGGAWKRGLIIRSIVIIPKQ